MNCVMKNILFLAQLLEIAANLNEIIDVITSRLVPIFPEILNFQIIHNPVCIFSHFGLCGQLETCVHNFRHSVNRRLSRDVDFVRVSRTYSHGIASYLFAAIIACCPVICHASG